VVGSCAPTARRDGLPAGQLAPKSPEPSVRVGLTVGAGSATIEGDAGLSVTDPSGGHLAEIPAGEVWRVGIEGNGLVVVNPGGGGSAPSEVLGIMSPDTSLLVRVNGRPYRGEIQILRDRTGLTVVNRVLLEEYLLGVVSAEMGHRSPNELSALRAQVVVARTYALRNLRRWEVQGFDLYATVVDEVYGGADAETPEGLDAVRATRGQILTYDGGPIDAFFFSTCGGRTADGTEIFRGADRPYLQSFADTADDGTAYCRISPRFRWREEWTGEELRATLQRTLPAIMGVPGSDVREVDDVRVAYHTRSGRVGQLTIELGGSEVQVDGPNVRQVLRAPSGDLLRSNDFSLTVTRVGRRVTRLVADGAGAGHGVGFCQWGAVGRSRAGQDYERILSAYFPGAALERLY
jgi:stage II sporulation protein D (peptidoglycan lytic transglycosylase)